MRAWWRFLKGPRCEDFAQLWLRRGFDQWQEEGDLLKALSVYVRQNAMMHLQAAGLRQELRFLIGSLEWLQALLAPKTFGWEALKASVHASAAAAASAIAAAPSAKPSAISATASTSAITSTINYATTSVPMSDNVGNLRWLIEDLASSAKWLHPEASGSVELRLSALVRLWVDFRGPLSLLQLLPSGVHLLR